MCSSTNGSSRSSRTAWCATNCTPTATGTLLRFTHRGLGVRNAGGFRGGTHAFLDRLEAHLAGDAAAGLDGTPLDVIDITSTDGDELT